MAMKTIANTTKNGYTLKLKRGATPGKYRVVTVDKNGKTVKVSRIVWPPEGTLYIYADDAV